MSLFKYMFDTDMIQRGDIEKLRRRARESASRQRRAASDTRHRIEQLEDEVGELALLNQALLHVLRESGQLDAAGLEAALEAIDAADGVVDGKVTREEDRPSASSAPATSPKPRKRHT